MFLTKQHVGVFLFIVLILSVIKDKQRVFKRIISFIIPIIICFIYLLFNNALKDFIDQCILGLFTFGGNNKRFDIIGLIFIIEFLFILYFIKKNPKKIENYYILAFSSMALPMIDLYHTQIINLTFIIILLLNVDISKKVLKYINIFSIAIIISSQLIILKDLERPITYPNKIHHFEYRYISNTALNKTKEVNKYLKKHDNVILLVSNAYYFKIINNKKIEKIDLINYGNSGYNGTKNNISYINNNKDSLYIIDESDLITKGQYDQKVLKYIVDNAKKIDTVGEYSVYSFEVVD